MTIVPDEVGAIRIALTARGNNGAGYGLLIIRAE